MFQLLNLLPKSCCNLKKLEPGGWGGGGGVDLSGHWQCCQLGKFLAGSGDFPDALATFSALWENVGVDSSTF